MTHYWRIRDVMDFSWALQAHSGPQPAPYPTDKAPRAFTAYSQRIPNPHLAGGGGATYCMGSARHISGVSIYGEMDLCSTDLQRDRSPKRCRNIAAISSNFCLLTMVTFIVWLTRWGSLDSQKGLGLTHIISTLTE
jgi:hypothetical protein